MESYLKCPSEDGTNNRAGLTLLGRFLPHFWRELVSTSVVFAPCSLNPQMWPQTFARRRLSDTFTAGAVAFDGVLENAELRAAKG